MSESQQLGNNHGSCPDLLDILREKRKVRLGHPQPGECIILEYSVEKKNFQSESDSSNHRDGNDKSNGRKRDQADASSNKKSKTVFISYSYDSDEHKKHVRELSERLNKMDGIKCVLDQDVDEMLDRWNRWMRKQIEEADFVVVICTSKYKERAETHRGSGVYIEADIIERQISYYCHYQKFISVIFDEKDCRYIPTFLDGLDRFTLDVKNEKEYEMNFKKLCDKVIAQPLKSRIQVRELYERGVRPPE